MSTTNQQGGDNLRHALAASPESGAPLEDRASIVAFLAAEAVRFDAATEQVTARLTLHNVHMRDRLLAQASLCRTLAAQIARGDDRLGGAK